MNIIYDANQQIGEWVDPLLSTTVDVLNQFSVDVY